MAFDFRCPPMPEDLATAARHAGRLDHVTPQGLRVTREWYFDQLAAWQTEHQPRRTYQPCLNDHS